MGRKLWLPLVLGVLATACGGTDEGAGDEAGGDRQTATDKGPLVVALPTEPRNLDPGSAGTDVMPVQRNILEPLVRVSEDGLIPVLATSWERVSETEWLFHLQEGVSFSNGKPFTAEAAAASINRVLDPATAADVLGAISSMEASAQSRYELLITTEEPNPILPIEMYLLPIAEPASVEGTNRARDPVGTGPYVVEEWRAGSHILLSRNDDYWGDQPEVENVRFVFRSASSVRAAMVETGEAHIAVTISPQDVSDAFETAKVMTIGTPFFRADAVCPTTSDIRVRRAINQALNREAIAEQLYGGAATPAHMIITPIIAGYTDEIRMPYDPEGAKALVAAARADGADLSHEMTIMIRENFPRNSSELAQVMQATLSDLGIASHIQTMGKGLWVGHAKVDQIPPDRCAIILSSHENASRDPAQTLQIYYHSSAAQVNVPDEQLDRMIEEAMALAPGPQRTAAMEEIFIYAHEELAPLIPVVHLQAIYGISPDIDWRPRSDGIIFVKDVSWN